MSPSPNRSAKSRKSPKAQSAVPSELVINSPEEPPAIAETPGESPVPADQVTASEPSELPTSSDAPASEETLPPPDPDLTPVAQVVPQDEPVSEATAQPVAESAPPNETVSVSNSVDEAIATDAEESLDSQAGLIPRQQPISPPSEPRQYRAVGLVRGRYSPSEEQFTRGLLFASDGTAIDAVLLGRVMSLVKNHLDLEQEHLWVVYPRTRQQDGNLHTQIMGVWEPETLARKEEEGNEQEEGESADSPIDPQSFIYHPSVDNGYFSIRGEVIYQSQDEDKYVIVKIKQAPRKDGDKTKFFKLKLKGALAEKAVGHFWDFHAHLEGNALLIQEANDIGSLPIKKKKFSPGVKGKRPFPKKGGDYQRPSRPNFKPAAGGPPVRKEAVPKPIKRSQPKEG
ncbi:MAG: hypothetical protein ACM37W_04890 [Actinomycetota bacterium]